MRIAVISWSSRSYGGVEEYVGQLLNLLKADGAEVGFFHEVDRPQDRPSLPVPQDIARWCVQDIGAEAAVAGLREWRPDVLYSQGLDDAALEERLLSIAPAALFIHAYGGTCISGLKTTSLPVAQPCSRQFGPACLLHYFPRRCGGLSPVTMVQLYKLQTRRLAMIRRYRAVLTHSEHMRQELLRNGVASDRLSKVAFCSSHENGNQQQSAPAARRRNSAAAEWRLAFLGRMDRLKGGAVLLQAAEAVAASLGAPLRLVFGGDGLARKQWERQGQRLQTRNAAIRVEFPGWLKREQVKALLASSHLLVVPSVWPEPFGQVGLEAAWAGIPVAAFNVGGIPEWLHDGVNGFLAPGNPPTAPGLANAIVRCLKDESVYEELCRNSSLQAGRFSHDNHLRQLKAVLESLVTENRNSPSLP